MTSRFCVFFLGLALAGTPALAQSSGSIIGGQDADPGEYPWAVALTTKNEPDDFQAQFCGGALIHPSWVVTAAHCVEDETIATMDVIVGAHDLDDPANTRIAITQIIRHPDFDPDSLDSDIALLKLATPADSPWLPLVSDTTLDDPGILSTVIGWGGTNTLSTLFPNILQEVEVPIVSNAAANAPLIYDGEVTANMLAAGYVAGGQDSCSGDSGGPLVAYNPDIDSWTLTGIVSWGGFLCGSPLRYGIYTRVFNFRPWVMEKIMPHYRAYEFNQGIRGRLHDPDDDGYSNFLEYAHNSHPVLYVSSLKPHPVVADDGGTPVPAITYRRWIVTNIDANYRPEVSTNGGVSWNPIDPVAHQVGPPVPVSTSTELVTIRDPAPTSDALLRVRVEQRP